MSMWEVVQGLCGLVVLLVTLGGAAGCGSNKLTPAVQPEPSAWNLPVPPLHGNLHRETAATGTHVFKEVDQYAGVGESWADTVLSLQAEGLAYSIIGYNVGEDEPLNLEVGGLVDGVWLGVSDYSSGRWRWLGDVHNESWTEELPEIGFVNEDGEIYFALVCPNGSQAMVAVVLTYEIQEPDDTDPPVWEPSGEGIYAIDTSEMGTPKIVWYTATDAESPPVTYLIYFAPTAVGIDWDTPQLTVPENFTSTAFYTTEDPSSYDYAVRARDAVGNVTTNQYYISSEQYEYYKLPIVDWEPGDRFEMSWLDESVDARLLLIGPGYLEGGPGEPGMLDGIVEFSQDSYDSGLTLEWARLLPGAPTGGYYVALYMGVGISGCETYSLRLLDESGSLKRDLGNLTDGTGSGAADYAYLRNGVDSWPQENVWEPGDRLEITWDDVGNDLSLVVEAPWYGLGSPAFPEDLDDILDFSADSEDSGESVEWIKLRPEADGGLYDFWLQWYESVDGPESVEATVTLYDNENQPKAAPCTVTITREWPEIMSLHWLDYYP